MIALHNRKRVWLFSSTILLFVIYLGLAPAEFTNKDSTFIRSTLVIPNISLQGFENWSHIWGGSGVDAAYGVAVDMKNSIFVAAATTRYGAGGNDATLAKYASNGTLLLNCTWGGTETDYAWGVAVDKDGNATLAGSTGSYGAGNWDAFAVKYATNGTQLWNATWGGLNLDSARGVAIDGNGSIYLAVQRFINPKWYAVLLKYAPNGTLLWNQPWTDPGSADGLATAVDAGGNAFLVGRTNGYGEGSDDAFIAKYDPDGNQLWNHTWGGSLSDYGMAVAVDAANNSYIAGYTSSYGAGDQDAFLAKYSPSGTQIWNLTWGGLYQDQAYGVTAAADGTTFISGQRIFTSGGNMFPVFAKIQPNGVLEYFRTWRTQGTTEEGTGIALDGNGDICLVGYMENQAYLVKFLAHGPPPIIINTPSPQAAFGAIAPYFKVTIDDPDFDHAWYIVGQSGIPRSFTPGIDSQINTGDWNSQSIGEIILNFWANTTQGDMGLASVVVQKISDGGFPAFIGGFLAVEYIFFGVVFGAFLYVEIIAPRRKKRDG